MSWLHSHMHRGAAIILGVVLSTVSADADQTSRTNTGNLLDGLRPSDSRFSPEVQQYLLDLQLEDSKRQVRQGFEKSAAFLNTARRVTSLSNTSSRQPAKVLYVVYTDSAFYDTRVQWIRNTWARKVAPNSLVAIGDIAASNKGIPIRGTKCPVHSHWEGACCKYAEAVIEAEKMLSQDPSYEMVYFTDDDSYVVPQNMETELGQLLPDTSPHGSVFGFWGCAAKQCVNALCGGGGYGATSKAVKSLVGLSAADFLRDQMNNCNKCDKWADVALSQVFDARNINKVQLHQTYGWRLKKESFDKSLETPPLLYHYIQQQNQMYALDKIFTERVAAKLQVGAVVKFDPKLCVKYQSEPVCIHTESPLDLPWDIL